MLRCLVMSDSLGPHGLYPTRPLCPWDFPGKNTGVGKHSLLQGIFPSQGSNPVSCIEGAFFTTRTTREMLRGGRQASGREQRTISPSEVWPPRRETQPSQQRPTAHPPLPRAPRPVDVRTPTFCRAPPAPPAPQRSSPRTEEQPQLSSRGSALPPPSPPHSGPPPASPSGPQRSQEKGLGQPLCAARPSQVCEPILGSLTRPWVSSASCRIPAASTRGPPLPLATPPASRLPLLP